MLNVSKCYLIIEFIMIYPKQFFLKNVIIMLFIYDDNDDDVVLQVIKLCDVIFFSFLGAFFVCCYNNLKKNKRK